MEKIKLYLIGGVSTKGCFYDTSDKKFYEEIYEISGLQYQSSFISLMSNQLTLKNLDIFEGVKDWDKNTLTRDMNKVFLEELIESRPDYIIVDLISEIEGSVIEIENTYISNIKGKTNKIDLKEYKTKEISIKSNTELYIELFVDKFTKFREFCEINLPKTKIIFHVAPYLYSYFDGCRVPKVFENKNLMYNNKVLKELYYTYCIKKDDLVVDINDKTYFSTSKHRISLNPLHYELRYYTDFISKLNHVVLKDFLKKGEIECQK